METSEQSRALVSWSQMIETWWTTLQIYLDYLLSPWSLIQFGLILSGFLAARALASLIRTPIETSVRQIHGRKRLLRFLALLLRRLDWLLFVPILWGTAFIIKSATWQSRAYFITIAANLATAWIVISIASRFIRNRTIANSLAVLAWSVAALNILGWLDDAVTLLDSAAFGLGTARISLLNIIEAALLCSVLLWLATALSDFVDRQLRASEDLTPSHQVLISKIVKTLLVATAILLSLSTVGIDLTVLTFFSGAFGLGIGFGLQKVVSNLISGIIILLDKSIKPGDVISLGERFGWITSLRARYVSVVTRDGVEYLIPNEDFVTQQVVNWSYSNRQIRTELSFGVSYNSNPHEVRRLAVDAISGIDRVLPSPPPVCHITGFGDSSIDFVARFWIRDPEMGLTNIRGQVFLALWDVFQEHDIEIPFPHRDIKLREPIIVEQKPRPRTRKSTDGKTRSKSAPGE